MLEGSAIVVTIVGGGRVALRKATALLAAGARVRVVAPDISEELEQAAAANESLTLTRARYSREHLDGAALVVAATNDSDLNATVALHAREMEKLVNVADAPELGNFVTPAVHRAGDLVVAVSTGRVPNAAARIRDSMAGSFDERYTSVVRALSELRRTLIDQGRREEWAEAAAALIGDDFCEQVESGALDARIAGWR
jgi:siroheme synthase-like protein